MIADLQTSNRPAWNLAVFLLAALCALPATVGAQEFAFRPISLSVGAPMIVRDTLRLSGSAEVAGQGVIETPAAAQIDVRRTLTVLESAPNGRWLTVRLAYGEGAGPPLAGRTYDVQIADSAVARVEDTATPPPDEAQQVLRDLESLLGLQNLARLFELLPVGEKELFPDQETIRYLLPVGSDEKLQHAVWKPGRMEDGFARFPLEVSLESPAWLASGRRADHSRDLTGEVVLSSDGTFLRVRLAGEQPLVDDLPTHREESVVEGRVEFSIERTRRLVLPPSAAP